MKNFWNNYLCIYDNLNKIKPYSDMVSVIVRELDLKPKCSVLDVGCGTGNISKKLVEHRAAVTGIDLSPRAILKSKAKAKGGKFFTHDINKKLPFKSSTFDRIVCSNTLYVAQRENIHFILSEFYRVLKKDGLIVITNQEAENFNLKELLKVHLESYPSLTKKFAHGIKFFIYISLIIPFDYLIGLNLKKGKFQYLYQKDIVLELEKIKFKVLKIDKVYGNQNFLIKIKK